MQGAPDNSDYFFSSTSTSTPFTIASSTTAIQGIELHQENQASGGENYGKPEIYRDEEEKRELWCGGEAGCAGLGGTGRLKLSQLFCSASFI